MRKKKVIGKFEIDPNYDHEEDVRKTIKEFRIYAYRKLEKIDSISDMKLQLVGMFSMIDSMAQERTNYPGGTNNCKVFCDFVLSLKSRYNYLGKVEPVTLFYHVEDQIGEKILIPGFPPEKEVSLDSLGKLDLRLVKDIIDSEKAIEILNYLALNKNHKFAEETAKQYRLINLIYRMRSKVTHEMTGLGQEAWHYSDYKIEEPYYCEIGRIYDSANDVISDEVCELSIPNRFIRNILVDCIEGYLSECSAQCRVPFENNTMTRKHRLSWYDK